MPAAARDVMARYVAASDAHDIDRVLSFIADDAVYLFSNESVHIGKDAVAAAIRHNFAAIEAESYAVSNVTWLVESEDAATCVYDYSWSGKIGGEPASGFGRGTTVLRRGGDAWRVVHEHLSRGRFRAE